MDITPQTVREGANAAHLTVNKFLERAGVSRSTFCRWQRGDGTPNPLTLRKLLDALKALEKAQ